MGGGLTFPFEGYYHASKHAVEALSDALRFGVESYGVDLSIMEFDLIRTRFSDTAADTLASATPDRSPCPAATSAVEKATAKSCRTPLMTAEPDAVAKAMTSRRRRSRYAFTPAARTPITLRAVTPGRAWDRPVGGM